MSLVDRLKKYSLPISIIAMVLLIIGTIVEGGSLSQKLLFVIGAPILGFTAYLNKQKMFISLQSMVTIGAILSFCDFLPSLLRYIILVGTGVISIGYLIKIKFSKEDAWWPLGSAGLLILAFGLSTSAIDFPMLFNSLLAIGGILVALYSAIGFFHFKVKIAIIWFILNLIFVINPMINIFSWIVC